MIDSQTLIDAEKLVLSQAMDGSQAVSYTHLTLPTIA